VKSRTRRNANFLAIRSCFHYEASDIHRDLRMSAVY
jgi:hypothetical protein